MSEEKLKSARQENPEGKNLSDAGVVAIVSVYEESHPLPEKTPEYRWILAVVGLVGSGKTTLMKRLSDDLSLVRVTNDDIRELLQERGFNTLRTVEIVWKIAKGILEKGYSLALDGDCVAPEHRQSIEKAAQANGIPLVYIHVNPPEEFILENNCYRDERASGTADGFINPGPGHATEDYYRRKPLHETYLSEITFDFTFDPSRRDFEEQVSKFESLMKKRGF